MSVRHGLLALLVERSRHGYELRAEFERRTGATWPLNVGQVYTTLARLERDGCVLAQGENDAGQNAYAITDTGREELRTWFATPVRRESRPRDELAIKLALAVDAPGVDIAAVIQAQRTDSLRALQDYTRLKVGAGRGDLAWQLVLEALVFQTEAEVRWLDHCEATVLRGRRAAPPPPEAHLPARADEQART
ncbi:MAG TPA: PadR family transcriptional regulator [Mycobacteriales bacterium]|jgi:DNA-binding PadR family transcriptional regulator|nr:PadR family transcriptional regulator [Mycobacteriales bacterium]